MAITKAITSRSWTHLLDSPVGAPSSVQVYGLRHQGMKRTGYRNPCSIRCASPEAACKLLELGLNICTEIITL